MIITFSGSAATAITYLQSFLSANVVMTNANQQYDGPFVSPPAGTWAFEGSILCSGTSGNRVVAHIWDGTTNYASAEGTLDANGLIQLSMPPVVVVLGVGATIKISAISTGASGNILAAANVNGAGNTASGIVATKYM